MLVFWYMCWNYIFVNKFIASNLYRVKFCFCSYWCLYVHFSTCFIILYCYASCNTSTKFPYETLLWPYQYNTSHCCNPINKKENWIPVLSVVCKRHLSFPSHCCEGSLLGFLDSESIFEFWNAVNRKFETKRNHIHWTGLHCQQKCIYH